MNPLGGHAPVLPPGLGWAAAERSWRPANLRRRVRNPTAHQRPRRQGRRASAARQRPGGRPSRGSDRRFAVPGWNELIAAAKQEGEVTIFLGRAASRQIRPAFAEFEKKFGVKTTPVIGSGGENADKVMAERDTGLYTGDLWMGGSTSMNTRLVPNNALDPIAHCSCCRR